MTWGMHAIGHLELGQEDEASKLFNRSYLPYVQVGLYLCLIVLFFAISTQPPFYMWTEVPGGGGAVNFITGMGGFLQAKLLYGISCSELPKPGSSSWISWGEGPT